MTTRRAGYIVTLAEDIREDEDLQIVNALAMVKGVISVKPLVSNWEVHLAEQRAHSEWRSKVAALVFPDSK